jgi:hypothetical protein
VLDSFSDQSMIGENSHAGSVLEGSPVSNAAWHRQPPKSSSFLGQDRHGSGIHSVPRKRLKLSESLQIQASDLSRTVSNARPGISPAALVRFPGSG